MDAYITHANALTCLGSGQELWERLLRGESGLSAAEDVYPDWFDGKRSRIGALGGLSRKRSRLLQIVEQVARSTFPAEMEECQIILAASSLGDLDGPYAGDPYGCLNHYFESAYPHMAPQLKGVVSSACSSGTDVLSIAAALVDQGTYDTIGILAVDCIDPGKLLQHFALGTQAAEAAMPFDEHRNGTSFGEGGGFALVVNSRGLQRLGAKEAFKILGYGLSCDAMYITAPDETGTIPALAIQRALTASSRSPADVGYINAHASGTPINDRVESIAFRMAFQDALDDIPLSGTKGAIGHLLGATGLVEAIVSCWALSHTLAPGTVGLSHPDPALSVNALPQGESYPIPRPIAISTTFGFGGVNSAIVIEKMH